ncbi:MAG: cell division protein FtsZ [Leptospiraceae bacterium]|nr:cell division protein FtsZ [Leptospiraceae bacterium]MCP5499624.1 cell division protein FtsZ [Leptospiraceae bacterium]
MMYMEEERTSPVTIKVVGVGGGGMNAVSRMLNSNLRGVEFIIMNTDQQVLAKSSIENKLQLGHKITRGMGAGGDPEIGEKSAAEDKDKITQALKGADMVFITAGMGGGTGTGAAPIIAEVARELKCLVVGVVTVPFAFEGRRRGDQAKRGLEKMRQHVDTLITIKNDSIFKVVDRSTSIDMAFKVIDDILVNAVKGISDIINNPGIINVDFADVRTIMKDTGDAIMGVGEGEGDNKVANAVENAINNVLLEETSVSGATSLLINVSGGTDLTIHDWNEVSQIITSQVDSNSNIIIGLNSDSSLQDKIRVTVIATGFNRKTASNVTPIKKDFREKEEIKHEMPNRQRVIGIPKEKEKEPEKETIEITRSIRGQRAGNPYNFNEDYDIPTYLRRPMNN